MLPKILKNIGFTKDDIIFSNDIMTYIIEKTPTEEGVRNLKRSIETIVSKINVSRLNAHNLLKLPFTIKDFKIPISITKEIVNVLLDDKLFTDLPPAFMYT